MFKKVIGQDSNESARPAAPAPAAPRQDVTPAPPQPAAAAPAPAPVHPAQTTMRNVLSTDVEIKGTVRFNDDLVVDGKIEGEISSSGNLTIGENANIKAEVKTGTIVVYGKVHGNLTGIERVELKTSAEVIGDITTKTLSMEAGAVFVGKSTVGESAVSQTKPAQPAGQAQNQPKQAPGQKPGQGKPNGGNQGPQGAQQGNLKGIKS